VHRLNLQSYLPISGRFKEIPHAEELPSDESLAKRVTLVLEELGPTFVKLGQILSSRPDIIPEQFVNELTRLQDNVQPFDFSQAQEIVERELCSPIRESFSSFSEEPIACGSIAQVHAATLLDGTKVVVKIKRPGIEQVILNDVDLLGLLAERAERIPEFATFRPTVLVEEFARSMRRELDFITEASNTSRFYEAFAEDPDVRVPRVFWEYTTSDVLTLERLEGFSLRDPSHLMQKGIDTKHLVHVLASAFMKQFFELGLFHADPHPGNLLVGEDQVLRIIDFGQVGLLSEEMKGHLATIFVALSQRNTEIVVDILREIGLLLNEEKSPSFEEDLNELFNRVYGIPLKKIDTRQVFGSLMRIMRQHGLVLPRDFVLMAKSFVTVAGLARSLDPDFNVAEAAEPYAKALIRDRYAPERLARSLGISLWQLSSIMRHLPSNLRQLMKKAVRGNLQIAFRHQGLETFISELDKASNRVTLSIILAAIILSSSMIIVNRVTMREISPLGAVGFILAGVLGLWLAVAILRSGRL